VQQRGDHQAVARLVVDLPREPVGGALRGDGVQAEALGDPLPDRGALKEVERAGAARDSEDRPRREDLDRLDGALDPPLVAAVDLIGEPQGRDRKRDVGLDGGDDVRRRRVALLEQAQHPVARFDHHRECLECLEGGRETAAMPFIVVPLPSCVWVGRGHRMFRESDLGHRFSSFSCQRFVGKPVSESGSTGPPLINLAAHISADVRVTFRELLDGG
jgi:hypothetical protein